MRLQVLTICFAMVATPMALAQIGNPGFMAPDTRMDAPGVPAPNQTNANDRLFAQLITEGGMAEVAFAELAAEKSQVSAVGEFASRIIDSHSVANSELSAIAEKSKIPLPDALNAEHDTMRSRLEKLDGIAFDLAYMRGQVVDHQKMIQLLIWQIDNGQDAELQRYASKKLPTILEHLSSARAVVTELAHDQVAQSGPQPANGPAKE